MLKLLHFLHVIIKGLTGFLKFANWLGFCLLIGFKKFDGQLPSLKVALVLILPSEV